MQESNRHHRPPLTEYEELRHQFNQVLDLLMPGEGHALLLLGDHGDRDPEALRDALVSVLNGALDEDGRFRPKHEAVLTVLRGAPGVEVGHLLDEYWWIEIYPTWEDPTGAPGLVTTADPAVAVLRVDESRDNLPLDYDFSPRLTPLTPQTTAAQRDRVIEDFLQTP